MTGGDGDRAPTAGPLRVLHCVAGNLYGGVESFLATVAARRDLTPELDPEFAVCFEGRLSGELRDLGVAVHHLGGVRYSRPWTVWNARRRLARVLRERRVDLVVTHCCWPQSLCGPPARAAGLPLVYWQHETIKEPLHWVEARAARVAPDLTLVHSYCTQATLPRLYPRMRSEVIRYPVGPRPVDVASARADLRAELKTASDDVVLVTASRLERWKGHPLLLDALGHLRDVPGWTAWVAGGAQRAEERAYLEGLKAQADTLGITDRLRFAGERRDVPRLLAAADIHCQPNLEPEPFGITFIEALYAGLPVVSVDMGGAAEIVTDACGLLTPPGDAAALAGALAGLIADPARRAALGSAGPARAAEMCDPAVVLPRVEALFTEVAAGRRGAVPQPAA